MADCPDCNQKVMDDGCGCDVLVPPRARDERAWIDTGKGRFARRCRALAVDVVELLATPSELGVAAPDDPVPTRETKIQCGASAPVSLFILTTEVPLCIAHAEAYWSAGEKIALAGWVPCASCGLRLTDHRTWGAKACIELLSDRYSETLEALMPFAALYDVHIEELPHWKIVLGERGRGVEPAILTREMLRTARDVVAKFRSAEPQGESAQTLAREDLIAAAKHTYGKRPEGSSWRPQNVNAAPHPAGLGTPGIFESEEDGVLAGRRCCRCKLKFEPGEASEPVSTTRWDTTVFKHAPGCPCPVVPETALRSEDIDERVRRKASPERRYDE